VKGCNTSEGLDACKVNIYDNIGMGFGMTAIFRFWGMALQKVA